MEFSGFKKALPFLESIRKNNSKEYFEAHRDEYEQYILNPSKAFVVEMGEHLMALEPTVDAEPKINRSLFKMYRDVRRMGENKEPMKSKIGIIFPQGGWSGCRLQKSSFYLHFSPDELFVAVGVRWFNKPMLDAYREYIGDEKRRVALDETLKKINALGYSIMGREYKKYPKGFTPQMKSVDLSLHKGMATYKILEPEIIEDGDKLIDTLYKIYEDMLPLQQIMYEVSLRAKGD
ncbi:MAG: TIGR02453 family protein [Sulfurimonas sp. RIFOXYD12_FULL_36_11]|nr:MAG: TIGR02453 family protein [Sulfurimonas sp. RIFOXYD2_FULL_37_8]OHE19243.1 MAG: TIGR02453 family protein [Sulfurimonas sp. RIFOXYD12_FULL_36_11]